MKKYYALAMLLMAILLQGVAAKSTAGQTAKPFLHSLFTDNMVLQRGVSAPVWGWAEPGAKISVSVAGKSASAITGADGKWMAKLPPLPVGGPYTLTVSGPQTVTLQNVLVGDVWICSGQSNMQMGIANVNNAKAEIADAENYPQIRLFTVPNVTAYRPAETVNGKWEVCTSQTVAANGWGGFTAVGYFFGRELHKKLHIPIGLIHTSWGGTIAEAWTSGEALKTMADFAPAVKQIEAIDVSKNGEDFGKQMTEWYAKNDPGSADGANWEKSESDASAWKTMPLPTAWESAGLPDYDGVVWFRKEIMLPDSFAGKTAMLHLGPIDDSDTTWVNGVKVGSESVYNTERDYKIPAGILKPGKNVVAVRVLDTGGAGGLYGKPEQMNLAADGETALSLAGDWQYNASLPLNKATPVPMQTSNNPNVVTVLYNGMIAPLIPFSIKGAIWYQGESNAGRADQYQILLPTLIKDWRSRFGVGAFPFYIVQLANFMAQDAEPKNDPWPLLREAQTLTAQHVSNSGIALAIDIGEAGDIHPKNKQEVGRRLALDALAQTYGVKVEYSGPVYKSMKIEGSVVRLTFDHIGGGLTAESLGPIVINHGLQPEKAELKGFAIAGEDGKFVWADAKIEGKTVVVSSPQVSKPTAVRYAWANNPVCNLYNKDGLPAVPFRTDAPKMKTAGTR